MFSKRRNYYEGLIISIRRTAGIGLTVVFVLQLSAWQGTDSSVMFNFGAHG